MSSSAAEKDALRRLSDGRSFRGRVLPGPGKAAIRILPESEEYRVPGTNKTLWIPRPNSHEGYLGIVHEPARPYFNAETGEEYAPIYAKGAIVLIGKFTGAPIEIGRDSFIVCRESDIVAELVPEPEEEIPRVSAAASVKTEFDS